ncbi:MAG TPA: bile acid:sodium symporter family protein [Nevskiaceae bacterium]|nr:bile acid:sodium symporter family protein [Nevskiaceae bacterium]
MENSVFATVLLPVALFVIMTGLGLSLTVGDFKRVWQFPRGVALGLANLLVISPLLGFGIATLLGLPPELGVGMVLLAASPGGTTANLLTHLARGDTALSVTLTAISSVAAVVITPLYLALSWRHFMGGEAGVALPMGPIVLRVLLITLLPLAFGMGLRARFPGFAARAEPWVKRLALLFFIGVVFGALIEARHEIAQYFAAAGLATLLLNVAAMSLSWWMSRAARLDHRQSTAIAIELGVHNTTLAMAVAALLASLSPLLIVPAAVYGVLMFFTAGAFAALVHRRNQQPAG